MHDTGPDTSDRREADLARHAEARALLDSGALGEAFQILSELVADGTPCWEVYNDLAAIAVMRDDLEAACDLLGAALECDQAPSVIALRRAELLATGGDVEQALAQISPALRQGDAGGHALALARQLIGAARAPLSPVAWARLVNDLRAPTPEQRRKDEHIVELERALRAQTDESRRLQALVDDLRAELKLPRLDRSMPGLDEAWQRIHALDDEQWLRALLRSVEVPSFEGFPLPGFPPEALQVGMVGSSNEGALREGMMFFRAVRDICARHGHVWDGNRRLLDFGTGWGRYARIFMRDFLPSNIVGVDVDPSYIKICRETFPYGRFETVPSLPPSDLADADFDLVVAYSVFSHLAEHAANAWIAEFARVLRPGGIVAITTQGRTFLEVCERMRSRDSFDHPWHQNLARSFVDRSACERAYDAGEFLFSPTGGGAARPSDFYGEALVPPGYVERHWTRDFELLEYIDDRGYLPQALIVLRRRGGADD